MYSNNQETGVRIFPPIPNKKDSVKTSELNSHQVELVIARILGYHARMPREGNIPYVMIDDWNKPGTIVNGCRFEPMTDEEHAGEISSPLRIMAKKADDGWMAASLNADLTVTLFSNAATRAIAISMCFLHAIYPEEVPDEMLEDNPL